jgi:Fic family protein
MKPILKLISDQYLASFQGQVKELKIDIEQLFENLKKPNSDLFEDYYNQVSAVYSSRIEGNSLDLNSFINDQGISKIKDKEEVEDLIQAYRFTQKNDLNLQNLFKVHKILSRNFLIKEKQGVFRDDKIGVFDGQGLVYLAIEAEKVEKEMNNLFQEIVALLEKELSILESFYYASLIHLRFAHIHPFSDGNGRIGRLLEKWFLSYKLGKKAWWIESEKYYFENRKEYYQNLNLGVNYYELNYSKSIDFLLMLIKSLKD